MFQRELIGINEYQNTVFISLNDRLQHISELNIEYIDMLKVDPTLSKNVLIVNDIKIDVKQKQRYMRIIKEV
ncbi:hypothetical protein LLP66_11835 [Staphylococcus capitis]|nr:hypothetical protein [Staphylococcus capitis]MCC3696441.1 hypothetical protein [Staphylococcus capitis]